MTRLRESFLILFFASLLVSIQSFAQASEYLSERVQMTLISSQRMDVADLLRIYSADAYQYEVRSISVVALSFLGNSQLELLVDGRSATGPQQLNRLPRVITLTPPPGVRLNMIDIYARGEMFIESISAEVVRVYSQPYPYPSPRPVPMPLPPSHRPRPIPAPRPMPLPPGHRPRPMPTPRPVPGPVHRPIPGPGPGGHHGPSHGGGHGRPLN